MSGAGRSVTVPLEDRAGQRWDLPADPAAGCLVVVDVQRSFADPAHLEGVGPEGLAAVEAAVQRSARLVEQARELGIGVVWVVLEQDPTQPWGSSQWLRRAEPDAVWPGPHDPCVAGTPGAELYGLERAPGEPVVVKRRYSGFLGTSLAEDLRGAGVSWVALCGLTTECCIDATARDAFQRGFRVVVTADATAAYEPAHHASSLDVLADNAAVVADADAVVATWAAARAVPTPLTSAGTRDVVVAS